MSGRSFDRRNEIARRRTSAYAVSIDVENDPVVADLLAQSRSDAVTTLFATVRPLHAGGGWDTPSLFSAARVACGQVAAEHRSVVGALPDGAMLCVLGPLQSRHAAHDLVDRLAVALQALDHVERGLLVVGFAIAESDAPSASTLVDRAAVAASHTDEASPVMAFTPFMEVATPAAPAPAEPEPERPADLTVEYDPIIDLRGRGRQEIVVRIVRDGERDVVGATLSEAATVLDRVAADVAATDARPAPSVVWIDAAASDLTEEAARQALVAAVVASGLSVGLLFAEAAIDKAGEPAVGAVADLVDRGINIGLREFTGRHLPTARLSELSLQQVTFASDFIDTIESESARDFLRQLVSALKRVGVDPVLSGAFDDLGDLADVSDVSMVRLAPIHELDLADPQSTGADTISNPVAVIDDPPPPPTA